MYICMHIYIYIYIYTYIIYIHAIMKTMCPPDHHHNGLVATHALGHDVRLCMVMHDGHCVYIYIYIYG